MKKWIKITLITVSSLIVILGLAFGGYYLWFRHELDKNNDEVVEETKPEEMRLIRELSHLVYESLPNKVSENFMVKESFLGYEEASITYDSNLPEVISPSGKVTRGTTDVVVKFSYTIKYKGYEDSFSKNITVIKLETVDRSDEIVKLIKDLIPSDVKNNTILPTSFEEFPEATIIWDKEIINRRTNEVEPTIKIVNIDGKDVLVFEKADIEEVCILNFKIEINGMTTNKKIAIYTKTTI